MPLTNFYNSIKATVNSLQQHSIMLQHTILQIASPQTSFGVRDKRTPKDVCGEAILQRDVIEKKRNEFEIV